MLNLTTNQTQSVVLTLSESKTITNPYWTFVISNRYTLVETTFAPDNFSTSPYYDSFTISIGASVSLTASVSLDIEAGEYHYSVYEMNTPYDLNINNSIGVAEVGMMIVSGTSSPIIAFTASDNSTIIAFENY